MQDRPQGLHTPLSAGGGGQSAGEAQLLAFARVFLKDPGVVVLYGVGGFVYAFSAQRLLPRLGEGGFVLTGGLALAAPPRLGAGLLHLDLLRRHPRR